MHLRCTLPSLAACGPRSRRLELRIGSCALAASLTFTCPGLGAPGVGWLNGQPRPSVFPFGLLQVPSVGGGVAFDVGACADGATRTLAWAEVVNKPSAESPDTGVLLSWDVMDLVNCDQIL